MLNWEPKSSIGTTSCIWEQTDKTISLSEVCSCAISGFHGGMAYKYSIQFRRKHSGKHSESEKNMEKLKKLYHERKCELEKNYNVDDGSFYNEKTKFKAKDYLLGGWLAKSKEFHGNSLKEENLGGGITALKITPYDKRYIAILLISLGSLFDMSAVMDDFIHAHDLPKEMIVTDSYLRSLVDSNKITKAITLAKKAMKDYARETLLFDLGEYCEKSNKQEFASQCYSSMPKSNSTYGVAAFRTFSIFQQLEKDDVAETTVPEKYLLPKLQALFGVPEEQQHLIDSYVNKELAGFPVGEDSPLKNIRVDVKTILQLCSCIKELNSQLKLLAGKTKTEDTTPRLC